MNIKSANDENGKMVNGKMFLTRCVAEIYHIKNRRKANFKPKRGTELWGEGWRALLPGSLQ